MSYEDHACERVIPMGAAVEEVQGRRDETSGAAKRVAERAENE